MKYLRNKTCTKFQVPLVWLSNLAREGLPSGISLQMIFFYQKHGFPNQPCFDTGQVRFLEDPRSLMRWELFPRPLVSDVGRRLSRPCKPSTAWYQERLWNHWMLGSKKEHVILPSLEIFHLKDINKHLIQTLSFH